MVKVRGSRCRHVQARAVRRRQGTALVVVALLLTLVLTAGGLTVDLSRLLMERAMLQSAVDASALAAVLELDGSDEGVERARAAALRNAGAHSGSVRCEFSTGTGGSWDEYPSQAGRIRTVRVTGQAPVTMTVVHAFVRKGASRIWAAATAEQQLRTEFQDGLFPYSPVATKAQGPHFGLRPGQLHTLRWAEKPSLEAGNVCAGDASQAVIGAALAEPQQPAGFVEIVSRDQVRAAILWDASSVARKVGDSLRGTAGVRALEVAALVERIGQDSDAVARTYSQYSASGLGNGRRLVAAPLHSIQPESRIVQVGAFFLLTADRYLGAGDRPFCAEYIGPYVQGSRRRGAAESGFHIARLVR